MIRSFCVRLFFVALTIALSGAAASADTLYVPAPAPVGPGHPLRLGPDHRASQPGDLVFVVFDFSATTTSTSVVTQNQSFNGGIGPGAGLAGVSILRFPTSLSGQSATSYNNAKNGTNTFTSTMMATVKDVLPSGALVVSGIQRIVINGQTQNMTVTGLARPEDIDNTDSLLSTRMANVELRFDGNFQEGNKGLIRRILEWLF